MRRLAGLVVVFVLATSGAAAAGDRHHHRHHRDHGDELHKRRCLIPEGCPIPPGGAK